MTPMLSAREVAELYGVSTRRVQALCHQGRIPGASISGRMWFVPSNFQVTPGRRGPPPRQLQP